MLGTFFHRIEPIVYLWKNSTAEPFYIRHHGLDSLSNIKFGANQQGAQLVENPILSVEKLGISWGEEKGLWGKRFQPEDLCGKRP